MNKKFTSFSSYLILILLFFSCDEILDIYPPEIELLSPTEDILTADTVTFLADASDNIGIERVAFKLRDPILCTGRGVIYGPQAQQPGADPGAEDPG